jgi:hypothetical protein
MLKIMANGKMTISDQKSKQFEILKDRKNNLAKLSLYSWCAAFDETMRLSAAFLEDMRIFLSRLGSSGRTAVLWPKIKEKN